MWNETQRTKAKVQGVRILKNQFQVIITPRIKGVESEKKPGIETAKETLRAARQSSKKLW